MKRNLFEDRLGELLHEKLMEFTGSDAQRNMLVEMAKIGTISVKNVDYVIAIWGDPAADRPLAPHIHIYRKDDSKNKFKNFNYELSLVRLLVNDEWFLLILD